MNLHDGAEVSPAHSVRWLVTSENDDVEQVGDSLVFSWIRRDEARDVLSAANEPDADDRTAFSPCSIV